MNSVNQEIMVEGGAEHDNPREVAPYKVEVSRRNVRGVLDEINVSCFQGYGPDWNFRGGALGTLADSHAAYEGLLQSLVDNPRVEIVPFNELLETEPKGETIRCAIRHDVDIDIRAALLQAEIERAFDIRTTYFVLHTAPYYGRFDQGCFYRYSQMASTYRAIQELGHEIAVHTDPFYVYQTAEMNGAEALSEEIQWLRGEGLNISGTTAHNSAPVYGAANYAIFKGRPQNFLADPNDCPAEVIHNGKWSPLGVLDERQLGLDYEANDVFWQREVPVRYGVTWGVNKWWWEDEKRTSSILDKNQTELGQTGYLDCDEVLARLGELAGPSYLVLVVHPLYYGLRHSSGSGPIKTRSICTTSTKTKLGWETYEPNSIVAKSATLKNGLHEFQFANLTDSVGVLDLPQNHENFSSAFYRVLMLGGGALASEYVGASGRVADRVRASLQEKYKEVSVRNLSYPGMGVTRLFGWYKEYLSKYQPDYVVIGLSTNEVRRSLVRHWRDESGFHPKTPPGVYLDFDGGKVQEIAQSPEALLNRTAARKIAPEHETSVEDLEYVNQALKYFIAVVKQNGSVPMILIEDFGEQDGCKFEDLSAQQRRISEEALQRMTVDVGAEIINPYECWVDDSYWKSVPAWNYTGHRIASNLLIDAIGRRIDDSKVA